MRKSLVSFLIFLIGNFAVSDEEAVPRPIDALWQNEEFRKAYTGSYGVDSKIHPLINEDESNALRDAAKLMSEGDRLGAIQALIDSELLKNSPALLFSLGNYYFEENEEELSIENYRKAIELFPNFRDAHRNLAILLIQVEKYREAETHLKRAIALGSQEGLTYGLLAFCHSLQNRYQAALSSYRMAQVTMPEELQWKLGEAASLQAMGEANAAISVYETLLKDRRDDTSIWINLANSRIQKEDQEDAIACLEIAKRLGNLSPMNQLILSQLYLEQGITELAVENIEDVLGKKQVPASRVVDCVVRLAQMEAWPAAGKIGKRCGELYKRELQETAQNEHAAKYHRTMALVESKTGSPERAAKRLEQILDKDPTDGDALMMLANFRETGGKIEEAILLYEQAATLPEKRAAALLGKGRLLAGEFRYKEALAALEESQTIDPNRSLGNYINAIGDLVTD